MEVEKVLFRTPIIESVVLDGNGDTYESISMSYPNDNIDYT